MQCLSPWYETFRKFQIEVFAALGAYIIDYIRVLVPSVAYLID